MVKSFIYSTQYKEKVANKRFVYMNYCIFAKIMRKVSVAKRFCSITEDYR